MTSIVILGAGLTGISAAYHLEKRGFFDYQIFEQAPSIGGLCGSIEQDGFTFDYTGHLLHTSNVYFRTLIETVVGLEHFNTISRKSYIYSHDTYTKYPFQTNLHGLPASVIADCIAGYVSRSTHIRKPKNFKEWVLKTFGSGFGKHFFFTYQPKIFSYPIERLTASWTGRFVPNTSLIDIINGALGNDLDDVGYNAQFLYPKSGGIVSWIKKLAHHIKNPIHTSYRVTKIDLQKKFITFANGHSQPFETLISTLPLDTLLKLSVERSSTSYNSALSHLRCNSVTNINIGLHHERLSDKHWIYFPEKKYAIYRVGFPHNFSRNVVPNGCSSLYAEFAHLHKSPSWIKETTKRAISDIHQLFGISHNDIATELIIPISHAYVIYNEWRDRNLPKLLSQLQQDGIHSVGRYGAWKYASMQESILDGKAIAEHLTVLPATQVKSTANVTSSSHSQPSQASL